MVMASGESDIYFGTDVGKWGAEGAGNFFLTCQRGKKSFSPHCTVLYCTVLKMLRFLWRIQIWVKKTKKISTP